MPPVQQDHFFFMERHVHAPETRIFSSSQSRGGYGRQLAERLELVDSLSPRELIAWQNRSVTNLKSRFSSQFKAESAVAFPVEGVVTVGQYQFAPFPFFQNGSRPLLPTVSLGTTGPRQQMTQSDAFGYDKATISENTRDDSHGGPMVDLSGYQNLTSPPTESGSGDSPVATLPPQPPQPQPQQYHPETETPRMNAMQTQFNAGNYPPQSSSSSHHDSSDHDADFDMYSEYSGNVKTLVQLVNDLPEGVTKQTGAQIIRLTMEAMGISMEAVLSDAQAVQSQLLDAVRSNIKKIEEYKTIIRKLETEIRYHQGKANELSEIIDLFILSNTSPNMPQMDRQQDSSY